ncbi:hypothetical protein [Bacteroides fragilis]|nr:hypothetical protein [Bacteroides fragilis]
MLERTSDGGYYAWLTVSMQCNAYGDIDILKKGGCVETLFTTE